MNQAQLNSEVDKAVTDRIDNATREYYRRTHSNGEYSVVVMDEVQAKYHLTEMEVENIVRAIAAHESGVLEP